MPPVAKNAMDRTIFVRELPFDATNAQLESIFEDVGPIRECFVIPGKAGKNKGFGFVQFATSEDALAAIQQFDGRAYLDRTLRVELAVRGKNEVENVKQTKSFIQRTVSSNTTTHVSGKPTPSKKKGKKDQAPASSASASSTPALSSTIVVVTGLSPNIKEATFRSHVPKSAKEIIFPSVESTPKHQAARLFFPDLETTTAALASMRADSFFGKKAQFKVVNEKVARVIIRNLSFKATEADIKSFCQSFDVVSIQLPKDEKGVPKGFAFVQFRMLPEATKAIETLNMQKIQNRSVALDWALNKTDYENRKQKQEAKVDNGQKAKQDLQENKQQAPKTRELAKVKEQHDGGDNDDVSSGDDDNEDDDVGEENEEEAEEADEGDGNMEGAEGWEGDDSSAEDEGDEVEDESEDEDGEKSAQKKEVKQGKNLISDAEEGATLFVRNLLFETTQQDVFDVFSKYGKVQYARLVPDKLAPELGRHNGSAFVKYYNVNDAKNVLDMFGEKDESSVLDKNQKNSNNNKKHVPVVHSTTTSDRALLLGGRPLKIVVAVTKQTAAKLKEKPEKNKDPRNLYLMREGLILEGSPAASEVSEGDLAKRAKAYKMKKENLKNSNYFVSKVRLSVRNLPLNITEAELKQLFLDTVKEAQAAHPPSDKSLLQPSIKQVKIVRDDKRSDAEGKPRSKRYGFIEFGKHEWALTALRALNNNPHVFTKQARPIIEFALDDHRKLLVRKKKHTRALATAAAREKKRELQRQEEAKLKQEASSSSVLPSLPAPAVGPTDQKAKDSDKKRRKKKKKVADSNAATHTNSNGVDSNSKKQKTTSSSSSASSSDSSSHVPTLAEALAAKMGLSKKPKQALSSPSSALTTTTISPVTIETILNKKANKRKQNTPNSQNQPNSSPPLAPSSTPSKKQQASNNKNQKQPSNQPQLRQPNNLTKKADKKKAAKPVMGTEGELPVHTATASEAPQPKKKRKVNQPTAAEIRDESEDQQFSSMVAKYKARFFNDTSAEAKARWYE